MSRLQLHCRPAAGSSGRGRGGGRAKRGGARGAARKSNPKSGGVKQAGVGKRRQARGQARTSVGYIDSRRRARLLGVRPVGSHHVVVFFT